MVPNPDWAGFVSPSRPNRFFGPVFFEKIFLLPCLLLNIMKGWRLNEKVSNREMALAFEEIYYRARQKHEEGSHEKALAQAMPLMAYPGQMTNENHWAQAWELFGGIVGGMGMEALSQHAMRVVVDQQNAKALYHLGYELNEQRFPEIAATVLNEAHLLDPFNEAILSELVVSFESAGMFDMAFMYLSGSVEFFPEDSVCHYLYCFNALMCGEVATARNVFSSCSQNQEVARDKGWKRISRILDRLDSLGGELGKQELRKWHFVLTGGILLHCSLHAEHQMHGRYGHFRESRLVVRKGVERLRACFQTWKHQPEAIYFFPDSKSEVLARVFGELEQIPVAPWLPHRGHEPGLYVIYDLRNADLAYLEKFETRREGQFLWAHMLCWVEDFPVTADFHTLMFQSSDRNWQVRNREEVASEVREVLKLDYLENPFDALEPYLHLVQELGKFPEGQPREKYFQGSPVYTNRKE